MRKSALHPTLRGSAILVPGHSGCYAVVPPPVPGSLAAPAYADLLMHMLDRREAVDSSQIEGTRTEFDELLLHELDVGTADAVSDSDAEQTLSYVRACTLGVQQVKKRGQRAPWTAH